MRSLLTRFLSDEGEKKILLLRHGQILSDVPEKRFIGQSDLPLSDMGRRQARYWADILSTLTVDRVVTSDLRRCMQTARIIAAGKSVPVLPNPDFREIHLGRWEQMTFARVRADWPDAFLRRGQDISEFRTPGGESFADLQRRVMPAFHHEADHPARTVLIIAHAGVNRVILCHLLGMPPSNLFRLAQDNGAMNLIARRTDGFRIQAINLSPDPPSASRRDDA